MPNRAQTTEFWINAMVTAGHRFAISKGAHGAKLYLVPKDEEAGEDLNLWHAFREHEADAFSHLRARVDRSGEVGASRDFGVPVVFDRGGMRLGY